MSQRTIVPSAATPTSSSPAAVKASAATAADSERISCMRPAASRLDQAHLTTIVTESDQRTAGCTATAVTAYHHSPSTNSSPDSITVAMYAPWSVPPFRDTSRPR